MPLSARARASVLIVDDFEDALELYHSTTFQGSEVTPTGAVLKYRMARPPSAVILSISECRDVAWTPHKNEGRSYFDKTRLGFYRACNGARAGRMRAADSIRDSKPCLPHDLLRTVNGYYCATDRDRSS